MKKILFILFFTAFFVSIALSEKITTDSINGTSVITTVSINSSNINSLGGWPIERRWYGMLVKKLKTAGAKRIFIDIAFPKADALHPESDEYFYTELLSFEDIYLLNQEDNNSKNDIYILGDKIFNFQRTFKSFSYSYSLLYNKLKFETGKGAFTDFFIPANITANKILVDLPANDLKATYNFNQILSDSIKTINGDVIILLDFPGVTSYIQTQDNRTASTGLLQSYAINEIIHKRYSYLPQNWILLTGFILIALLLLTAYLFRKAFRILSYTSIIIWPAITIIFFILNYYLPSIWFLITIPLVFQIIYLYYRKTKNNSKLTEIKISNNESDKQNEEQLKELQYKLDYYENLSSQLPLEDREDDYSRFGIILGAGSPMVEVLKKAEQVAKNDIPVLIYGESGTGKEKLANFIHAHSPRAKNPFIAINCGALNENLIESELFGFEKGAFTGATQQKIGRFEMADGGTLFLDEILETSPNFQIKLLRVLQEGTFERVGGTKPVQVSVRIIAATNKDLKESIGNKLFREDLYYRLNGYSFMLPSLKKRKDDISALFKYFLFNINTELKYSETLIDWLKEQPWHGNIRELKASIERAVINAGVHNRSFLIPKDFGIPSTGNENTNCLESTPQNVLDAFRKHEFSHRSITQVATDLAMHRSTITEYLRGWVIRMLIQNNCDIEEVINSLRGDAKINDETAFRNRINEYITYIESRIEDGIFKSFSDDEISVKLFKNIPAFFKTDLLRLINGKRNNN